MSRLIVLLLMLVVLVMPAWAQDVTPSPPAATTALVQPHFAVGVGTFAPVDLGFLQALKGTDAKTYLWGQLTNPVAYGAALRLRAEQVMQRDPTGDRPPVTFRLELGYGSGF